MKINIIAGLPRVPWGKVWGVTLTALTLAAVTIEPPLWALAFLALSAWVTLWQIVRKENTPRYKRHG